MKIVLLGPIVAGYGPRLKQMLRVPAEIAAIADPHGADAHAALADADVAILNEWTADMLPAPRLRLIQVGGAGTDAIDRTAIPPGVPLCNAFGHEPAIAEYVVGSLLSCFHDLRGLDRSFRAGSWSLGPFAQGAMHEELAGRTVGILGVGRVAGEIARRLAPFDVQVIGCNRSGRPANGIERVLPITELSGFLAACDVIVVACALTPETQGLLDADRLAELPRHAVLVNIARGPVIVEAALFQALKTRRIAGAILDVWYRYPTPDAPDVRPAAAPFHTLDNVLMTPHASAWTPAMLTRRIDQVADNINRLATGEPLLNLVE